MHGTFAVSFFGRDKRESVSSCTPTTAGEMCRSPVNDANVIQVHGEGGRKGG